MNAGGVDDIHRAGKHSISAQNAPNLGFLSLGGGLSGSGNGGNGSDSRPTAEEGSHGFSGDQADAYYRNMLQKDPNNPLFLSNYAQLLAEVSSTSDDDDDDDGDDARSVVLLPSHHAPRIFSNPSPCSALMC
jgi:hypothetical protein